MTSPAKFERFNPFIEDCDTLDDLLRSKAIFASWKVAGLVSYHSSHVQGTRCNDRGSSLLYGIGYMRALCDRKPNPVCRPLDPDPIAKTDCHRRSLSIEPRLRYRERVEAPNYRLLGAAELYDQRVRPQDRMFAAHLGSIRTVCWGGGGVGYARAHL